MSSPTELLLGEIEELRPGPDVLALTMKLRSPLTLPAFLRLGNPKSSLLAVLGVLPY